AGATLDSHSEDVFGLRTREEPIIGRPVLGVARERDYPLMRSPPVCRTGGNHGVTVQSGCRSGYPQENCGGGSPTKRTAGAGLREQHFRHNAVWAQGTGGFLAEIGRAHV